MPLLAPDRYYTSVETIDLDALKASGVRALLLDLDETLLPRNTNEITDRLRKWTARIREAGFDACLVSNNWHARVHHAAAELGIQLVPRALKPFPFAFRRAMRLLGVTPEETAVVGDQIFTDILGGHLVGVTTVLVQPLSRADPPHTLFLRLIEARILSDRTPDA